jgi:hypothetical protein
LSFVALAAAETTPPGMAARTELHTIDTLTLSDAQFLKGDPGGKATTLTGELRIASGAGRLPLVMLQHGSGGMAANVEMWTREFNAMGISTFALDGFTGRGLTAVNANQALLGRLNFILDNYRALEVLAKHPRIDPERIVLMGFSRGGQAALYASLNALMRSGINRAPSSPDIFRSIPTARPHSYLTSKWPIARFESLAERRTITIQLLSASLTSSACMQRARM